MKKSQLIVIGFVLILLTSYNTQSALTSETINTFSLNIKNYTNNYEISYNISIDYNNTKTYYNGTIVANTENYESIIELIEEKLNNGIEKSGKKMRITRNQIKTYQTIQQIQ